MESVREKPIALSKIDAEGTATLRAAPRIYVVSTQGGLAPSICSTAARLHFNWIDLPLREARAVERWQDWIDAAHEAGLGVVAALDTAMLSESEPQGVATTVLEQLVSAGIAGLRCYRAQQAPSDWWRGLLRAARASAPDLVWVLDAIGATEDDTAELLKARFDWYLSSSKWWNGRDAWAVAQYERFRPLAQSIGFPENLNGERLRTEIARSGARDDRAILDRYRLRYALAAFFDDGVMMPMGYEAGEMADRPPDAARLDLRATVTAVNRVKAAYVGPLCRLPQQRLADGDGFLVARISSDRHAASCFVANPSSRGMTIDIPAMADRARIAMRHLRDVTPDGAAHLIDYPLWMPPFSWRFFARLAETPSIVQPRRATRREPPKATPTPAAPRLRGQRIAIERMAPELDRGRFAVKRVVGDRLEVAADIFRDGHEVLKAALLLRREDETNWTPTLMRHRENDRWVGVAALNENRRHRYTIEAWTDPFASARERLTKNYDAGLDVAAEITECQELILAAAKSADAIPARRLKRIAEESSADHLLADRLDTIMAPETEALMAEWGPRRDVTRYEHELEVIVDRPAARFSAWYEMFPRSQGTIPGQGATFRDCIARLDDIRAMGFDVVYLVPIHPIGEKNRKGRNNSLAAKAGDPGSPYAIGNAQGGHCAVDPALGTLDDFDAFVAACRERGIEVAFDFAVQASPDHPWIAEHPEWFEFRPDGSIRFAENPPKKYQDIVNFNFNTGAWRELWTALRDVVLFWIGHGVRIFRVDNPHTKPFPFWEWLIREVQTQHPDTIFLAEAFTRPKVMEELAKLGFTQSYTYFTWRNEKQELIDYFSHLTRDEPGQYFRPHLFTNTPDILPRFLQQGGPPAFRIRAVLAATLGGLFGIYNGFELCENRALPDSEEYRDSEKYEYKVWDWDRPDNIKPLLARLNRIRRDNIAFVNWLNLEFLPSDNPAVIFYARHDFIAHNHVFIAVSLDPFTPQSSVVDLPLDRLGIADFEDYAVDELLEGNALHWVGKRQQIQLDPEHSALIARLTKSRATEA